MNTIESFSNFFRPIHATLPEPNQVQSNRLKSLASMVENQAECALFCNCSSISVIPLEHDGLIFLLNPKEPSFHGHPWAAFLNKGARRVVDATEGGHFLGEVEMTTMLLRILVYGKVQHNWRLEESFIKMYLGGDLRSIAGFVYPSNSDEPIAVFSNRRQRDQYISKVA